MIKASGTLSMTEIATEFPDTKPYLLSEFYRGGGKVPNGISQNANISTSGIIRMGSFYGALKDRVITGGTITSDANYIYHTFTSSGTFSIGYGPLDVTVWVIGGGGGGNSWFDGGSWDGGGGGCAVSNLTLSSGSLPVTVGGGGYGTGMGSAGGGGASSFSGLIGYGGGGAYYPGVGAGGSATGGNVANYSGGSGGRGSGDYSSRGGNAGGHGTVVYSGAGGWYFGYAPGGNGGLYGGGGGGSGSGGGGSGASGVVVIRYAKPT